MGPWGLCLICRGRLHAELRRQLLNCRLQRLHTGGHTRKLQLNVESASDDSSRSRPARRSDSRIENTRDRVERTDAGNRRGQSDARRGDTKPHRQTRSDRAGTNDMGARGQLTMRARDRMMRPREVSHTVNRAQSPRNSANFQPESATPHAGSRRILWAGTDAPDTTPLPHKNFSKPPRFPSFRAGPPESPPIQSIDTDKPDAAVKIAPAREVSNTSYEQDVRDAIAAKHPAREVSNTSYEQDVRDAIAAKQPSAFDPALTAEWAILKGSGSRTGTKQGMRMPTGSTKSLPIRSDKRPETVIGDRERLMYAFGGTAPPAPPAPKQRAPVEEANVAPTDPAPVLEDAAPLDESHSRGRSRSRSDFIIDEAEDETEVPARGKRKARARASLREREDEEKEDDTRRHKFDDDVDPDLQQLREMRDRRRREKQAKRKAEAEAAARKRLEKAERMTPISIPDFVTMTRLAQMLGISYRTLERTMSRLGFTAASPDHILSAEDAGLAAIEHNFDPGASEHDAESGRDLYARPPPADQSALPSRPPVVAIMGHVDHGKTTLLDFLRNTAVAAGEHGGITQHIGAFNVPLASGRTITFLDTPGHAAFLAMRQRGATITDIIILVVAADDSVKPQTLEALKHAKAAGVPIIVAVNKIDKEEADVRRVKNDLARHGVEIEEFGGDTQVIPVSGKTGQGLDELEEAVVTLSEILDHRADPAAPVEGWVIEATVKASGRAATVLVRQGTLEVGDIIVAGQTYARVRTLRNESGRLLDRAPPGFPVEVEGWRDEPVAGDEVLEAPNEQRAHSVVEHRIAANERARLSTDVEAVNRSRQLSHEKRVREKRRAEAGTAPPTAAATGAEAEAEAEPAGEAGPKTVPFIIKADVSGSAEAVNDYLLQLANPLCSPRVLRTGVGPVSEFDIEHAAVAEGHIIAFNLPRDAASLGAAARRGVKLLYQDVIYRIVQDVREVLEERLEPVVTARVTGEAEIAGVFEIGLGGKKRLLVAGCRIRNGLVSRRAKVRVMRDGVKIYDGRISSLKNVKKDVDEMRKGSECGMAFEKWGDFQPGDAVQTYEEKVEKRTLQF